MSQLILIDSFGRQRIIHRPLIANCVTNVAAAHAVLLVVAADDIVAKSGAIVFCVAKEFRYIRREFVSNVNSHKFCINNLCERTTSCEAIWRGNMNVGVLLV